MTNETILKPETYSEPEAEYIDESVVVKADDVRKGDRVRGRVVAVVKHGTKWTYLRDGDDKLIVEVENDKDVEVERRRQTPESRNAQHRAYVNRRIAEKLAGRHERLRLAMSKVHDEVNTNHEAGYNAISEFLAAQAELKIYHELAGIALTSAEGLDLVDAQQELSERLTQRLIQETRHRALSRSTSVVANLLEDVDREAMARFIDNVRWSL